MRLIPAFLCAAVGAGGGCELELFSPIDRVSVTEREDGAAAVRFCRSHGLLFCEEVQDRLEAYHNGQSVSLSRSFGNSYVGVIEDIDRDQPFHVTYAFAGPGAGGIEIHLPEPFELLQPEAEAAYSRRDGLRLRWAPSDRAGSMSASIAADCQDSSEIRDVEIEGDPGEWTVRPRDLPRIGDDRCSVSVILERRIYGDGPAAFAGARREVVVFGRQTREVAIDLRP
jgi:hypothetical protein